MMRLFFVLLFLTINVCAQNIPIGILDSIENISLDSINKKLFIYYKNHYETINLSTLDRSDTDIFVPTDFSFKLYKPIIIDSTHYFVHRSGGMVFQLENDSVKRIDRSFDHKMQHGSLIFSHNSKLYKYGGYGFWSARNFFIYFDKRIKEWEVISPLNSKIIPEGSQYGEFIKNGSEFFLFNGATVNPYNRFEHPLNDEVWKYDLDEHIWTYLGKASKTTTHDFTINNLRLNTTFIIDNKIVFFDQSKFYEIDVVKNKIITYYKNSVSNYFYTRQEFEYKGFNPFKLNGKIHYFKGNKKPLVLKIVNPTDFFGEKIAETEFYKKNYLTKASVTFGVVLILLSVLLGVLLNYKRKINKIIVLKNGLKYHFQFMEFDKESMKIIKLLLSQKEVQSNAILKFVEKEQFSDSHNERLKVHKLDEINLKIKTLTGTSKGVIKSRKSQDDKRIRVYSILRSYFK